MAQLTTLLAQLAAKLGTTVQYLFQIEVRQMYVSAMQYAIWGIALLALCIFFWSGVVAVEKERKKANEDDIGTTVLVGVFAIGATCGVLAILTHIIGLIIDPQYYAFTTILQALHVHIP